MSGVYIIFLDVDGVLFSPWHHKINYCDDVVYNDLVPHFDDVALDNLNMLMDNVTIKTGMPVRIVLSSAWRNLGILDTLKQMFQMHKFSEYIIDKTPFLENNRDIEIKTWLEINKQKYNILNYIVLDDNDFNLTNTFGKKFIHCDSTKLFDNDRYELALKIMLHYPLKEDIRWYTLQDRNATNLFIIMLINSILIWICIFYLLLWKI